MPFQLEGNCTELCSPFHSMAGLERDLVKSWVAKNKIRIRQGVQWTLPLENSPVNCRCNPASVCSFYLIFFVKWLKYKATKQIKSLFLITVLSNGSNSSQGSTTAGLCSWVCHTCPLDNPGARTFDPIFQRWSALSELWLLPFWISFLLPVKGIIHFSHLKGMVSLKLLKVLGIPLYSNKFKVLYISVSPPPLFLI